MQVHADTTGLVDFASEEPADKFAAHANALPLQALLGHLQRGLQRGVQSQSSNQAPDAGAAAKSGASELNWIVEVQALEQSLEQAIERDRTTSSLRVIELPRPPNSQGSLHPSGVQESAPRASLTVICEGAHSALKQELGVLTTHTPYNQLALATRIQVEEPHQGVAYQWFNSELTPELRAPADDSIRLEGPEGLEILALLPSGGEGAHLYSVVWSGPVEYIKTIQALPDEEFTRLLSKHIRGRFQKISVLGPRSTWPLVKRTTQQWFGALSPRASWVLCGDSAHSVHPLAGMGLNLGLADAKALHDVLLKRERTSSWRTVCDTRVLAEYERERKLSIWAPTQSIDLIQRLFASDYPFVATLRNRGFDAFNRLQSLKAWTIKQALRASTGVTRTD
jgi:ubiquinone biosynthesis UbiH/UbiF/VisC/COQ6 family hydroxylase